MSDSGATIGSLTISSRSSASRRPEELLVLLTETLEGIFAIKERAANRIEPGTKTIATVIEVIQFDFPTVDFPE